MRQWLAALVSCSISLACSGGADSASQSIKAAEGGTVSAAGLTVTIPAGALAADTTITVAVGDKAGSPDAANVVSAVFTLGPDGTQFAHPVALAMDFDGAAAPAGKSIAIAFLQGGAWTALADSAVSGTKVTATTTHFSVFAIVWIGGQAVGEGCSAIPFTTACGGDASGSWTLVAGCLEESSPSPLTSCPGSTMTRDVDVTGTLSLTVTATQTSGPYGNYSLDGHRFVPYTIVAGAGSCATLSGACAAQAEDYRARGGGTMTDIAGQCTVKVPNENVSAAGWGGTGTYYTFQQSAIQPGNKLRFIGTGSPGFFGNEWTDYCITGTTMTISAAGTRYQLTR